MHSKSDDYYYLCISKMHLAAIPSGDGNVHSLCKSIWVVVIVVAYPSRMRIARRLTCRADADIECIGI